MIDWLILAFLTIAAVALIYFLPPTDPDGEAA